MPARIGVYCDVCNLYHCVRESFEGRKLNYKEYIDFIAPLGDVQLCKAYGAQSEDEATPFITFLKKLGFQTYWKRVKFHSNNAKADWDVGITIDMVRDLPSLDVIVLGSADSDMVPAVKYIQEQNTDVIILASKISVELRRAAYKAIEITEGMVQ